MLLDLAKWPDLDFSELAKKFDLARNTVVALVGVADRRGEDESSLARYAYQPHLVPSYLQSMRPCAKVIQGWTPRSNHPRLDGLPQLCMDPQALLLA